jgi:hypothetical protein
MLCFVIVVIDKHFCGAFTEIPHDFCASCPTVNSNVNRVRVPTKKSAKKNTQSARLRETKYKTPKLSEIGGGVGCLVCPITAVPSRYMHISSAACAPSH